MAPKGVMATEVGLNGSLIQATAGMLADYSKTASNFDDAVRLLHSLQARQEDHGKLMESVVQTLSQVGAGLEALTHSVAKTVAGELAATRSIVHDVARAHSGDLKLLANGHADTTVQLAAAIEQNGQKAEQLSTQLSDNIEARIHHAVKEAIAPMGLTVADQMQRLEKAFSQFPQDSPAGRPFDQARAASDRAEMVASH
jgi:ABC-type transporter Mla subunit MlaD